MYHVEVLRKALRDLADRQRGQRPQPRIHSNQKNSDPGTNLGLPEVELGAIQVLDPEDESFGKFYFLPGYSRPGGPDVIEP